MLDLMARQFCSAWNTASRMLSGYWAEVCVHWAQYGLFKDDKTVEVRPDHKFVTEKLSGKTIVENVKFHPKRYLLQPFGDVA